MWSQAVHYDAVLRSSRRNPVRVTMEYHDRFRCHGVKPGGALSKRGSLRRRIQLATDQHIDGVDLSLSSPLRTRFRSLSARFKSGIHTGSMVVVEVCVSVSTSNFRFVLRVAIVVADAVTSTALSGESDGDASVRWSQV